jgi:DNA-binding MarR family transcriptional regulator
MQDGQPTPEAAALPVQTPHHPPDDQPRLAFLLLLLSAAPHRRLTQGDLKRKLRTRAAASRGLTPESAGALLGRCEAQGHVRREQTRRTVTYTLTDAGAAHLSTLGAPPLAVRGNIVPPANDQIRTYRTAYLLFEVLRAPGQSLAEAEASDHVSDYARDRLDLNVATARHLWKEFAAQGLLTRSGEGRIARYSLTPAGRVKLANADFPKDREFRLKGDALAALLEAAREVGKQFTPEPSEPGESPVDDARLERAVLAAFEELLRERHTVTGMVPIHEVRAEVRRRLGDRATRHDTFDPVVVRLRQTGQFRLVPITDQSGAEAEQLQASIPGVGETLFYLEVAHEPAAR